MNAKNTSQVYSVGVCQCSVCAPKDMPRNQVTAETNTTHPTGLDHGWSISDEPTFKGGQPNPSVCEHDTDRLHYLMVC